MMVVWTVETVRNGRKVAGSYFVRKVSNQFFFFFCLSVTDKKALTRIVNLSLWLVIRRSLCL